MPFENVSKRRLAFAPKLIVVKNDQPSFTIQIGEVNLVNTVHISAPGKMINLCKSIKPGEFEKLPELVQIEGHLSLPDDMTLLAAQLKHIDGDLHIGAGARFYAPLLEEVTGFIYVGERAVVNAPKIDFLLSNDDASKIQQQSESESDWLNTL